MIIDFPRLLPRLTVLIRRFTPVKQGHLLSAILPFSGISIQKCCGRADRTIPVSARRNFTRVRRSSVVGIYQYGSTFSIAISTMFNSHSSQAVLLLWRASDGQTLGFSGGSVMQGSVSFD